MPLFARNEEINQWLAENPMVVGAGATVIGLVIIAFGVSALLTGEAITKRGPNLQGGQAKAMAFIWLGFGTLCLLFGAFKVVSGLL